MSVRDKNVMGNLSDGRLKPKKRSQVERELETSLTARVTSPLSHSDSSSTSRYGRSRRLKSNTDNMGPEKLVTRTLKSPSSEKSPATQCSPVYKMHASNSPIRIESPKKVIPTDANLENQIENIYHENISLSRFGSEEKKKLSPAKKFSKIYVRKDMIQNVDSEDIVQNIFSSKKKSSSHINNILERSSDKYSLNGNVSLNSNRSKNGHVDTSSVVKTLDFDSGKKKRENRDSKSVSKSEMFEIEAKCEYQVGDLAWARVGTYPFWPCIVTREPMSGMFVKKKMFGRVEHDIIHVTFFGDNGRRGWIVDNMLRKYLGVLEFQATKEEFTVEAKKKDPKFYAAFFISEKKLPQWNISVKEAETLLREPKRLRIDILNEMLQISRSSKSGGARASSQTTRTNSDVSLSESLYDTLFSEDDGKSDDFDRSRSKTRKKSLDVSEVVTACLDNMAAKSGITKIQRQSHMDRWLQKAKSKTPEKSQPKTAQNNDKSFGNNSKKKRKLSSGNLPSQKSGKVTVLKFFTESHNTSQNYLKSHENEHDYTSPTSKLKERQSVSPKTVINGDEDESIHGIDETLNKPHNVTSDESNGIISYSKYDTSMNQPDLIVEEIIFGSDEIACEDITVVENNMLNKEPTLGQDNLKTFKLTDDDILTKCELVTKSDLDTIVKTAPTYEIDKNSLVDRKTKDQTESSEKLENELNVEQISDEAKGDVSEEEISSICLESASEKNITDIEIHDKFKDNKSTLDDNVQISNTRNTDEKQLIKTAPTCEIDKNHLVDRKTEDRTESLEKLEHELNVEQISDEVKGDVSKEEFASISLESTTEKNITDIEIDDKFEDKSRLDDNVQIGNTSNTDEKQLIKTAPTCEIDKNRLVDRKTKDRTESFEKLENELNVEQISDEVKGDVSKEEIASISLESTEKYITDIEIDDKFKDNKSRLDDNVQIGNTSNTDEKQLIKTTPTCDIDKNHLVDLKTKDQTESLEKLENELNVEQISDEAKGDVSEEEVASISLESTSEKNITDIEIDDKFKDNKSRLDDNVQIGNTSNTDEKQLIKTAPTCEIDKNNLVDRKNKDRTESFEKLENELIVEQIYDEAKSDVSEEEISSISLESTTEKNITDIEIDDKFKDNKSRFDDNVQIGNANNTDEKQLVDDEVPVEIFSCKSESNDQIEQYTTIVCPESTINEKSNDVEMDNNSIDYKLRFHDEKQINTNTHTECTLPKVDKNAVIETTIAKVFTDTEFVEQVEKSNQNINDKNADNSEQITLESVTDSTADTETDKKFKNETDLRDLKTVEVFNQNVNDVSTEEALVYQEDDVNFDKNASSEEMSEVESENCEKNDLTIDKLDTDKHICSKYGDLTNKIIDFPLDAGNNDINSIKMFEEQILNGKLDADSDTVSSTKNKMAMECKCTDSINNLNNGEIEQINNDKINENMTNAMIIIPDLDKTDSDEDKETSKTCEEKNNLSAEKIINLVNENENLVEIETQDLQTGKADSRINNIVLGNEEKIANDFNLVNSIANNESLVNRCHNIKEISPQGKIKDEYDTISINSEDSEISLSKKKTRSKNSSRQGSNNMTEALENPDFLQYLELRQDTLIDENPQLTQEEIANYLYKTWLYEENLKSDTKKTDDMEHSNLVKGLKQEPVQKPKKTRRKKAEKEPIFEVEVDEELPPKDKPKRKLAKPFYNYDCSDIEEEIEMFEIFKSKKEPQKSESSTSESQKLEIENLNLQIEKKDEVVEVIEEIPSDIEYDQVEEYFKQLTKPKPNLFKGLVRERVCDICERPTNLVKCKVCRDMFHIDCVKKQSEIVEETTPTRGRKKKKKPRGRKPKSLDDSTSGLDSESHSDTKSQDANLSEEYHNMSIEEVMEQESHIVVNADDFEAYASVKMRELFENPTVSNYYNNDCDIQWKVSVAGHCEIVDVKFTNESIDADNSNFKCHNCQKYNLPVCFVCKLPVSPKNQVEHRQKCQVGSCNKYYHLECLDHWPQTQYNSGECRSKGNAQFEPLTCARHVCHTCVSDDPRGCKTRFCSDKLARCVRCPATYHCFTKCLPAGTQILTGSYIICPRHYEHRPGKVACHVNTGWCFICALGGSLICCEYCPTSFHAECLNIKPPEGGYMCEDCETGRLPLYGEMVWVKLGHYRWWPGMILHPSEIPHNIMAVKHSLGEFVVRFFGQYDHYWVNRGRVFPFQEGDSGKVSSQKSKIDEAFSTAMEHAKRACETLKGAEPNAEECHELALSLLPPQYVKLKCNKPRGALLGWRPDHAEHSLTQCECDPAEDGVCGPYTSCINRMLLTECGPSCRAGDRCNNRAFEKRQYPRMVPYRTPHRGWGLKTLEDIKQGQFVIEYVGELIDLEEFQRRMRRKHEVRDENYYFLTLDKERMIDAGPKGNLARFMNHCCEPNCETQKWTVLGDVRVGLFALRDIPANSELTFNYNLESDGIEKKRCLCGARRCAGYIGAKPKQDEQVKKNKRVYKKRKPIEESPTTSFKSKPKPRLTTRSTKPKELTDIEKDLLIIKSATNGLSSDSDVSGRLSSIESERKDNRPPKRKRVDRSTDDLPSVNGRTSPPEKRLKVVLEKSSLEVALRDFGS